MGEKKRKPTPIEAMVWSIALPGFGQLLIGDYYVGTLLLIVDLIINVQSQFNQIIFLSLTGEVSKAIEAANIPWLSFYPCFYFFSMYHVYRTSGGGKGNRYTFLPFVFSAYFATVGIFYASHARIAGHLMGPLWFPLICFIPGVLIGLAMKYLLCRWIH